MLFFSSSVEFRRWLARHHATTRELWVGFHRRASGTPSMTWSESVDEALCYGWIDGIRKRVDASRYKIRFTRRTPKSVWSAINIAKANVLKKQRRMRAAGLAAFARRTENRSGVYSYEQRTDRLDEPYASRLREHDAAWRFFNAQPPSYRKMIGWWVVSAKKDETRRMRFDRLVAASKEGRRL